MARARSLLTMRGRPLLRRLLLSEVLGPPRAFEAHSTALARPRQRAAPPSPSVGATRDGAPARDVDAPDDRDDGVGE